MSEEQNQKEMQELQLLQQNIQQINSRKQEFQKELLETESALEELKNTKKPYKIIGNIMVQTKKSKLKKELKEKEKKFKSKIEALENQEEELNKRGKKLQEKLMKNLENG